MKVNMFGYIWTIQEVLLTIAVIILIITNIITLVLYNRNQYFTSRRNNMNFKEIKNKSGMTQKQISEYLKIPMPTIEAWCRETRTPPEYLIELIEYKMRKEGLL